VKHILEDSAEEFCRFLAFATYIELTEAVGEKRFINQTKNDLKADVKNKNARIKALKRQLKKAKEENDEIRASWAFRIGKLIVWLPGKIKRIFKK
jgi:uncharacterized protein YhaN